MRFLDLSLGEDVPDAKTIWLFREQLTEVGVIEKAFEQFEAYLCNASRPQADRRRQHSSRTEAEEQTEENKGIKQGEVPEDWSEQRSDRGTDTRWTKKKGQNYYGYKKHIDIDVKHKLIRSYEVTPQRYDRQAMRTLHNI